MAVIGINYDGGNRYDENDELVEAPVNYESVYLHYDGGEKIFNSGNFVKDWYDAKKFYLNELSETEYLSGSSTCDHFIMDGAKFDSAYLHVIDEVPVLKYLDREDPKWYLSKDADGWEFFVEEGTKPTWEELRAFCGDPKKSE